MRQNRSEKPGRKFTLKYIEDIKKHTKKKKKYVKSQTDLYIGAEAFASSTTTETITTIALVERDRKQRKTASLTKEQKKIKN